MKRIHIKPTYSYYWCKVGFHIERLYNLNPDDLEKLIKGNKKAPLGGIAIHIHLIMLKVAVYFIFILPKSNSIKIGG